VVPAQVTDPAIIESIRHDYQFEPPDNFPWDFCV
jgi:hypothetical protein